jgi:hypothetical protein
MGPGVCTKQLAAHPCNAGACAVLPHTEPTGYLCLECSKAQAAALWPLVGAAQSLGSNGTPQSAAAPHQTLPQATPVKQSTLRAAVTHCQLPAPMR